MDSKIVTDLTELEADPAGGLTPSREGQGERKDAGRRRCQLEARVSPRSSLNGDDRDAGAGSRGRPDSRGRTCDRRSAGVGNDHGPERSHRHLRARPRPFRRWAK